MITGIILVKEPWEIFSHLFIMYRFAFCNDEPSALNPPVKTDKLSVEKNVVATISNKSEDLKQWSSSSPMRIETNLNLNKAYVPKERFLFFFLLFWQVFFNTA